VSELAPYWKNYIDGRWVDGGAGRLVVEDPATGEPLAEQALADQFDVDKAVAAAKRCHASGALTTLRPCDRGCMVRRLGDFLRERANEIARVLTLESGKPLWESHIEIEGAARYFEYYGNQAETLEGRSIPLGSAYLDFTLHEPYGVSAQIIPWNYPLEMTARSLAPALAADNACVVKTPELSVPACATRTRTASTKLSSPSSAPRTSRISASIRRSSAIMSTPRRWLRNSLRKSWRAKRCCRTSRPGARSRRVRRFPPLERLDGEGPYPETAGERWSFARTAAAAP
jgi:hypothetical protein